MPPAPELQIALDTASTAAALKLLESIHPFVDIVEIGTPLIIEEGLSSLETLKAKFPDKKYLADLKIMDAGYLEAQSGFRRGADIVTVLALADDSTIEGVLRAATEHDGCVMADLINTPHLEQRVRQLEEMGVHILCLHTAFDKQNQNIDPLGDLHRIRPIVSCRLAVAGGLTLNTVDQAMKAKADIAVVGGAITNHAEPREAAEKIMKRIKNRLGDKVS